MSATTEWMKDNPDKCGACGGVGAEYIPGEGFMNWGCEACDGTGLSDEYREPTPAASTTIGFSLPSPQS